MAAYNKAIVAALAAIVAILGAFNITLPWFTPEVQSAIASVIGGILVYAVPNAKT